MGRLISIIREETKVQVKIEEGPLGGVYPFTYECDNKWYAELLATHFNRKLESLIQDIRKEEYEKGYKDGRAKRAKKNWFDSYLRRG